MHGVRGDTAERGLPSLATGERAAERSLDGPSSPSALLEAYSSSAAADAALEEDAAAATAAAAAASAPSMELVVHALVRLLALPLGCKRATRRRGWSDDCGSCWGSA